MSLEESLQYRVGALEAQLAVLSDKLHISNLVNEYLLTQLALSSPAITTAEAAVQTSPPRVEPPTPRLSTAFANKLSERASLRSKVNQRHGSYPSTTVTNDNST